MRELFIGYTRHIREDPSEFCLIADCFEKCNMTGHWMEQILKEVQSLRLFEEDGTRCDYPSMIPARSGQSYSQRYQAIASMTLADGKVLVRKTLYTATRR